MPTKNENIIQENGRQSVKPNPFGSLYGVIQGAFSSDKEEYSEPKGVDVFVIFPGFAFLVMSLF